VENGLYYDIIKRSYILNNITKNIFSNTTSYINLYNSYYMAITKYFVG